MFEFVGIPSEKKEGDFPREGWIAFKLRIFLSVFQDGKNFRQYSLAAFKDKMILLLAKAVVVNRHFARSWREHMSWRQGKFY